MLPPDLHVARVAITSSSTAGQVTTGILVSGPPSNQFFRLWAYTAHVNGVSVPSNTWRVAWFDGVSGNRLVGGQVTGNQVISGWLPGGIPLSLGSSIFWEITSSAASIPFVVYAYYSTEVS